MVFRTLAHQLASSNPDIGEAIREVVEKNANIWILPLRLQFIRLLLEPLSTFKHLSDTIVVVLDGLDECGTARERGELLEILTTDFIHLPFVYVLLSRVVLTSIFTTHSPQNITSSPTSWTSRRRLSPTIFIVLSNPHVTHTQSTTVSAVSQGLARRGYTS